QQVSTYADLVRLIEENRGETVPVTYLRPTRVDNALGDLGDLYVYESGLVALTPETAGEGIEERTGMELCDLYVADVDQGSPEQLAGPQVGDRIVAVDDLQPAGWSMYEEPATAPPLRPHTVSWLRGTERMKGTFQPRIEVIADEYGSGPARPVLGARNWVLTVPEASVGRPSVFNYALPSALDETMDVIRFIYVGITKIAKGELSLSTIGGPITVYDVIIQERDKGHSY